MSKDAEQAAFENQPKRSIIEIINDPDVSAEDKYKVAMAHNVCLSEYCHILRESLASIVQACNRHIMHLASSPLTIPAEMQQMFFDIGTAASTAAQAKVANEDDRGSDGAPLSLAAKTAPAGGIPIHTLN